MFVVVVFVVVVVVLFWAGWHAVTQMAEIAAPTIMMLRSVLKVMFLVPLGEIVSASAGVEGVTDLDDAAARKKS